MSINLMSRTCTVEITTFSDMLEQIASAETEVQVRMIFERLEGGFLRNELEMTDENWDEATKIVRYRLYGQEGLLGYLPELFLEEESLPPASKQLFLPLSTEFTSCIALREFDMHCGELIKTISIEIGLPAYDVLTLDAHDWRCPVRISYGEIIDHLCVSGVDSYQVIGMAFSLIEWELFKTTEKGVKLSLLDGRYVPFETNYERMHFKCSPDAAEMTSFADTLEQITRAETYVQITRLLERLERSSVRAGVEVTDENWEELLKAMNLRLHGHKGLWGHQSKCLWEAITASLILEEESLPPMSVPSSSPESTEFTACIASREFEMQFGELMNKIIVEIGLPVIMDENHWQCPARISNGETIVNLYTGGVDSYQAIGMAFNLIEGELFKITEKGVKLSLSGAPYVPFNTSYDGIYFYHKY